MKTIAFLLEGFQRIGGIGRSTSILINQLSENSNYKVISISYINDESQNIYPISDKIYKFYLYQKKPEHKKPNFLLRIIKARQAIKKVKNIIKENNIDFLVACSINYFLLGLSSVRNTKCKCICWEHTDPSIKMRKVLMFARGQAIRKAYKNVVLTKKSKEYYIKHLNARPDKVFQIYNPIDENTKKSKKYNNDSKKIISVGRLVHEKNFALLIEIANEIILKNYDWSWDIYGDGKLYIELQNKIKNLNLVNKIQLKGKVDNLCDLYQEYSFLVMTSEHEGFPMVLLEAISNRLPVISFNIPGPDEVIINGENGYLITPFNKNEMINKIQFIINQKQIRKELSEGSYKKAQFYSTKLILEKWENIWN